MSSGALGLAFVLGLFGVAFLYQISSTLGDIYKELRGIRADMRSDEELRP